MNKKNLNKYKQMIVMNKKIVTSVSAIVVAFVIGWMLPSPLFRFGKMIGDEQLTDTTNMKMPDGSVYNGSILANTQTREGYGKLTMPDGTVYEGTWKDDNLPYGIRHSRVSEYKGHFNNDLQNDGFGIVTYNEEYFAQERNKGKGDNKICAKYVGNWKKDVKQGIGRSVMKDNTMTFGIYEKGNLISTEKPNYRVGGSVYGIDVSHYQKDINWDNLAIYCDANGKYVSRDSKTSFMQPVFFVYMKATEGDSHKDDMYAVRCTEAERHEIVKGAYHYFHIECSVDAQVQNFLSTVTWKQGDLPPALDVEENDDKVAENGGKAKLQEKVLEWLDKVEKKIGVKPIIYTRERIRNECLSDNRFKTYDFWIARYSEQLPDNFDWHIWQFHEKGKINGLGDTDKVDINLFKSDYTAFMKYLGQQK